MTAQTRVEGLPGYRASTLLAASSTLANSIEGGFQPSTLVNGSQAYALDTGRTYRWNETSLATANGISVILPSGQAAGTPGRWIEVPLSNEVTGVIQNLNDVRAIAGTPVGGEYLMPGGSYAVTTSIALDATLAIDNDTTFYGRSPGAGFTINSATPLVNVDNSAILSMDRLNLQNTGGTALQVVTGECYPTECVLDGNAAIGVINGGSRWVGSNNIIRTVAQYAFSLTGSDMFETDTRIISTTNGFNHDGAAGLLSLTGCNVSCGNTGCRLRGSRVELFGSLINSGADGQAAVSMNGIDELLIQGCTLTAPVVGLNKFGLLVGNDANTSLIVTDTAFRNVNTGIFKTGGATQVSVIVAGNYMESTVPDGINWQNGVFPTSGISIIGNTILGANPFLNFTAASVGASVRSNMGAAGQLSESALVP